MRETLGKVEAEFGEIEPEAVSILAQAFSTILDKPKATSKPAKANRG
jgi:hypothetical protein